MREQSPTRHNILYFSSFGSMKGGGQRSLFYLIRGLDKTIFNPIVICPEEGDLLEKLREIGVETLVLPLKRLRQMSVGCVLRLLRFYQERNISIVHTDSTTNTFYAGIAARLLGIPLIWHIRVSNASWLDRLLALLATKLILVAKSLESRFSYLDADKVVPIINGISVEEFDACPPVKIRDEFEISHEALVIGSIGRIEEMKGQEYLVRALAIVVSRNSLRKDIRVLFIGEADELYRQKVAGLIDSLKLKKIFTYLGYRTDTPGIIKELDILISASSFGEGLSRVILEAMAAGKPVIATTVGGAGEAVVEGVNGYLIPSRDHLALAEAICKLLDNPELSKSMGVHGRQRVEQQFSLADNIRKTEQLYLGILKNAV